MPPPPPSLHHSHTHWGIHACTMSPPPPLAQPCTMCPPPCCCHAPCTRPPCHTQARSMLIKRGESAGLDWSGSMLELKSQDLGSIFNQVSNSKVSYPDYYTRPFHAYPQVRNTTRGPSMHTPRCALLHAALPCIPPGAYYYMRPFHAYPQVRTTTRGSSMHTPRCVLVHAALPCIPPGAY